MTSKRILIVEDENIVALDMRMRLEALGYEVIGVVDSGAAAIERIVVEPRPDLVLMDIKIRGEVDGIETARRARESAEVPVVFVTAFTDERTLERAKHASPYGYVVKPFHERELRIAIELALYKFQYEQSIRRAKEIAEETSRLKGEFLANVSHELKTPLNSVIGFSELALDLASCEEQREYIASAIRSAKSLATLIDSILDFARLESGRMAFSPRPFSLDELLAECAELLAVGAHSKGLEVGFRRDPSIPDALEGDEGRLRQLFRNLIDNAVKFTDRGSIRLAVECLGGKAERERLPGAPDHVRGASAVAAPPRGIVLRFMLRDTGAGMPPERISTAFERFRQLDGSRTRTAGGTGLGLAIVDKSIELLGASLSVWSRPGEGTAFELLLPLGVHESAQSPHRSLGGRAIAAVGFPVSHRADLEELVASLEGALVFRASLAEARAADDAVILAEESVIVREHDEAYAIAPRLIAALRYGGGGRADLPPCARIALPVRATPLFDAFAALERRGLSGASSGAANGAADIAASIASVAVPLREQGSSHARAADGGAVSPSKAPSGLQIDVDGEARSALVRFAHELSRAGGQGDFLLAEKLAKKFREQSLERGDETCERLAFSAMLCARREDAQGLGELAARAKAVAAVFKA